MAAQLFPSYEYVFNAFNNLTLPHVYENEDEIGLYRHRFEQGLQQLSQQLSLATPEAKRIACKIMLRTNFYLAYQGLNDKDLQCQYGNLVHQIIAANYPHLAQKLTMPPLDDTSKIRVGYVSAYHNHPGISPFIGYLRYGNRQNISIYSYLSGDIDNASQIVRDNSDVFHHIPNNWESLCEQILADKLHILVYPEIGMEKTIFQIAALRLAPIQCMAWGHPVTSGLPTIDYYLSSELIEPENAQDHYTEKLIRLANIGVAYPNPTLNITNY
jgi:predicted O-linked N-acetylglucosamine transferase (SPINDLY family)